MIDEKIALNLPIPSRPYRLLNNISNEDTGIKLNVLSYNILAFGYDHREWMPYASELSLNFWYRYPRILKEIE